MKKIFFTFLIPFFLISVEAKSAPVVGEAAPNFKASNSNGEGFELAELKGRIVVLEWTNHQCPFVKKHYETNNMQGLQKKYTEKEVIWVSIVSSAPGNQGYLENGAAVNKVFADRNSAPTHIIRDETGKIGKLYTAATTPHMFIVDKLGNLAYQGAIDSKSSASKDDVETAKNYVSAALDELLADKEVSKKVTTPYGCSVKY